MKVIAKIEIQEKFIAWNIKKGIDKIPSLCYNTIKGVIEMEIRTIGELRNLIKNLDDDFKIEVKIMEEIPDEELEGMSYPYPWKMTEATLEMADVGYSDKVLNLRIYEK